MPKFLMAMLCLVMGGAAFAATDVDTFFQQIRSRALEQSPDVQIARINAGQSKAHLYTAWTAWVPHADLLLSTSESKDYSIVTSGQLGGLSNLITPISTHLQKWSINMSLPLYRRSVHLGVEEASTQKEIAYNLADSKVMELDWRLRELLGNYLLESYRMVNIDHNIEIAKSNLREANLRFELGQRTKIDVLRSQSNLTSLQSQESTARSQISSAASALIEYSGVTEKDLRGLGIAEITHSEDSLGEAIEHFSAVTDLTEKLKTYLAPDEINDEFRATLWKQIGESSTVYRNLTLQDGLSDTQAAQVMAQVWPDLSIQANLNKQTPDWGNSFNSNQVSHSVALVFTLPIFSGGSTYSTYLEKSHGQESNRIKAARDIMAFRDEVENDLLKIKSQMKSIESQKVTRDQNEEIVRLTNKSYQLGKSTIVDLLGSQQDLLQSKINLAKSKIDLSVLLRKFAWNIGVNI